MKFEPKNNCPLHNFEPCKQLECAWFTKIRGVNPNTGEEIDDYSCAVAWIPVLLIENSLQQRQTGAAVESFRNEMVKTNESSIQLLMTMNKQNEQQAKQINQNVIEVKQ
jgi:hypothetical protein